MSGFASEVAKSRVPSQSAPPPPTSTDTVPTTAAPELQGGPQDVTFDMPKHGEPHPDHQTADPTPNVQAEPTKQGKIRIGSEVFDTQEEALAYANELQLTMAQKDAIEHYKAQEAQNKKEPEVEADPFEGFDQKIFEDPKAAAKQILELAEANALKKIRAEQESARKEQEALIERQQAEESAWSQFSSNNQDLAQSRDVVQYIIDRNVAEISKLPLDKRESFIANKTRAFLGSTRESMLPSRELQNKTVTTPMSSNSSTVQSTPENKSQALDFLSQVRKHTKRVPS